ncbi:MAG: hypothetical protein O3A00_04140 [Planctomycetota bacterium]|nr:hypothetical protein [Planctomycetota bacterium]
MRTVEKGASLEELKDLPLDVAPEVALATWVEYLEERHLKQSAMRQLVARLHAQRRHEIVIAVIQAALIHDQSQPWMYDVLALSMKIAKRPESEIKRVLYSRVDHSATDVQSMMFSAAYLASFGAKAEALRMYRQASEIDQTRPEPYVLGLRLARELNDYDAIKWCAPGILAYVWTPNHGRLHREALDTATDAQRELIEAGKKVEAESIATALEEGKKRDLSLRLTWSGIGDVDLVVEEPLGTICSYQNPISRGGGILTHDGSGPIQKNCFEDYVCPFGVPGNYRIRIRHIWGNIVGKRAQLLVTRYQGTEHETTRKYSVQLDKDDAIVRVSLKQGRRKDLAPFTLQKSTRMTGSSGPRVATRPSSEGLRSAAQFIRSRQRAARGGRPDVGYRPNITILNDGISLTAQAVISADRRYVRISMAPSFQSIIGVVQFSPVNNGNAGGFPGGQVPGTGGGGGIGAGQGGFGGFGGGP